MATASDRQNEDARVRAKERNNYDSGRTGANPPQKPGPAYGGSKSGNPTRNGGINRATTGNG